MLFSFPSAPFPRNKKEDGTLKLYYLSAYCLSKILLLQLVGHNLRFKIEIFDQVDYYLFWSFTNSNLCSKI
ncbi:hypothetical protein R3W88_011365 [Solanum pinnatisectum]|uniref:Uncharacterized protein n=1 Tax=Solanum pinnatisectum TaxID=50273 RepID=A0AAV9L5Z7_9SOLN|nr:hypothetical protein R3W88_011365 [Solanum pinnatisectum]